ncbi:hypothetical protein V1477_008809 [Vespula maculifrons]|uniref:Uncharacterized protein n=1 Tax=Vespula maculifrons TaxID=7453 RepID=A0ABD2CET4_VESMC
METRENKDIKERFGSNFDRRREWATSVGTSWSITWPGTSFGGLSYDVICEVAGMDEPPMSRLDEWEKGRKRGFQTLTKKL